MKAGKRQQESSKGSCYRFFHGSAGQEVSYLEPNDRGNPVSQLQSSDFTKGLFSSVDGLQMKNSWPPFLSSSWHCGYHLPQVKSGQV